MASVFCLLPFGLFICQRNMVQSGKIVQMTAMLAPDQSFDFTLGHKRSPEVIGHTDNAGAQVVAILISAERRLKLF